MGNFEPLLPPDKHYVSAAQGWFELGDIDAAAAELDRVKPANSSHPEVLETQWCIGSRRGDWEKCLDLGLRLLEIAPDRPSGYINASVAYYKTGRLAEAWDTLHPVAERFSKVWMVPYNLACYACQMGRHDEAIDWCKRSFDTGNKDFIKNVALHDPDLQALWPRIKEL